VNVNVAATATFTIFVKGYHQPGQAVQKKVTVSVCDGEVVTPKSYAPLAFLYHVGDTGKEITNL
jgi:hypothetical protein